MLRFFYIMGLVGAAWPKMLPPTNSIQGDGQCGLYVCVNATVYGDTVTYELTGLEEPLGWLAVGFGNRMQHTHMVIMWPNEDGTTTLSQRMGMGHSEPLPVEYPPRLATIVKPRISTLWHPKAVKTLAFSVPVNKTLLALNNPTERLIWAYSKIRPEKPHYSELTQHYVAGFLRLNLVAKMPEFVPTVEPATHDVTPQSAEIDSVLTSDPHISHKRHEALIVAHGVLGSIGFLVFLPAGALVARWGRTLTPKWFRIHRTINMSIALPIITVGWILGPIAVLEHQATHLFDIHQITGVFLVILYYLQLSLGQYIHKRKMNAQPNGPTHPPSNILHVVLGLFIVALAFTQTRSGMEEWRKATGRSHVAHWCHDLWNAWVVTIPVVYIAGTVMLRRQFFQERNGLTPGSNNYLALSPDASSSGAAFDTPNNGVLDESLSAHHNVNALKTREFESSIPLLNSHH